MSSSQNQYFGQFKDVTPRDELIGGTSIPIFTRNIEVDSDTQLERGMLLCSDETFGTFEPVDSTDTAKVFVIAENDFTADSDHTVTSAYTSGIFNRERIKLKTGLDIKTFEEALRKENIHLTKIFDLFGRSERDFPIGN